MDNLDPYPNGILAPGVLLMRWLRFAPKMALLMLIMGLAVAVPTAAFLHAKLEQIAFSAKERDGVRYLQALYPALVISTEVRRDAQAVAAGANAPLEQSRAKLQQALQTLEREQQALGEFLGTQAAFAAVQQAVRGAQLQAGDGVATFIRFSAAPAALVDLAAQVCDGSNLTLDLEVHTFYVMDAVCFRLPDMIKRTADMRGVGAAVLRVGAMTPELRDRIAIDLAVTTTLLQATKAGLGKTQAQRPETESRTDLRQLLPPLDAFTALVRQQVLDANELLAERAPAYVDSGNAALRAQQDGVNRLLPLLDELLQERIQAMQRVLYGMLFLVLVAVAVSIYFVMSYQRMLSQCIGHMRRYLGAMAQRDFSAVPPVWVGADELVRLTTDVRVLHDEMSSQLRLLQRASQTLDKEANQTASTIHYVSPAILQLHAKIMREIAADLAAALNRYRLR